MQVLIIDDDESIRETLRIFLEYEGYTVATASDGRRGMELLGRLPEPPDLILLDLMMPDMDGWQFLEAIASHGPLARSVPVVAITAYADRMQDLPVREVLKKPVDLDTLQQVVRRYCGQGIDGKGLAA